MNNDSVAFFGLEGDPFSARAEEHLRVHFSHVASFLGTNEVPPRSPDPGNLDVDWLFSFKTKTIFREHTLSSVRLGALNFHTASPKYPGSGGVNWVLYNDDPDSAITVHHITPGVDAGQIVRVDRFDRDGADNVQALLMLTYRRHLETFKSVTAEIASEGVSWLDKPPSDQVWGSKTYRIRDLEELKRITPEMDAAEVARRVKATFYGRFGPYISVHGHRFQYAGSDDD